jgi:uncharacterized protein (TIGR01777 family)
MHVVVAGATGFLGQNLVEALRAHGHTTTSLVRRAPEVDAESRWDPSSGLLDAQVIEDADVVVNVAGSSLLGVPHTDSYARKLRESRISTTAFLSDAVAASDKKPAFLAQNGTARYGDHGSDRVTEDTDARSHTLMGGVTRDWEDAVASAEEAGARVCVLRTAPVLDRQAMPLTILRPLFRLGLGGRLGPGDQYFPLVSLRDWMRAACHLAESPDAAGPFNVCCPRTPTNAEFTRALARALGRPAVLPVPAAALRIGAGPLAPELLASVNLVPQALIDSGFEFRDHDVTDVLASGLAGRR